MEKKNKVRTCGNPKNHKDQWLVAKEYFNDNFEELI